MLPVQMSDSSFVLNESGMSKPVKSEDLQNRKNFTDVYESVSSARSEPGCNDEEKVKFLKKENSEKTLEMTSKSTADGEETQVSPKKRKLANLSKKNKVVNSRAIREKLTDLSLSVKTSGGKTGKKSEIRNVNSDTTEVLPVNDQDILEDSDDLPESTDNVVNSSGMLILEQSKVSVVISPVNQGESEDLVKKSGESLTEKSKLKNKKSGKQSRISVLDLRESPSGVIKTKHDASGVAMERHRLSSQQLEQMQSSDSNETEAAKPIVVELTHIKDNFSSESKTMTTATGSSLMKQLEESINNKIVKQTSVILKDDNSGEIKLILKPEALGKVRIRLSLNDNRIVGQIIVENVSVKEIFEQNLQNLERAFKENGFDIAGMNVSVGGNGMGSGNRENNGDIAKQMEIIDGAIPTIIAESDNFIDLIA